MRITRAAAGITCAVFIVLVPGAAAKPGHGGRDAGISAATVDGPGLHAPLHLEGRGPAATALVVHTRLASALDRAGPVAARKPPPRAGLGPGYDLTYRLTPRRAEDVGLDAGVVRQRLYPYAEHGPWVFMPAGQGGLSHGWWSASSELLGDLELLGLPEETPGTQAAADPQPSRPDPGVWPWVGLAAALVLAATALGARARAGMASA